MTTDLHPDGFIIDGIQYIDRDTYARSTGRAMGDTRHYIYDMAGSFQGEVFKSECGEYWVYDGDTSGQIHENEPDAYLQARQALIAGNMMF